MATGTNRRRERSDLKKRERVLSRAYVVVAAADLVLLAALILAIQSGARWPGGLLAVALLVSLPTIVWLSWPYRQWHSGRPDYRWGTLPFTDPEEMVRRSGWPPRVVGTVLAILGLIDIGLIALIVWA